MGGMRKYLIFGGERREEKIFSFPWGRQESNEEGGVW